jgi:hypothetical protein
MGERCPSDFLPELLAILGVAKNLKSSSELILLGQTVKELAQKNSYARCKLF